ncbi:hypothetical protein O3P69_001843 [Scylla paramamosain]|uniref:Microtubule-associated protein Jupiter n=3 Tax=Scylla paramamosain TaxID=85552 RepID=A0AAW0UZT0_SCYPA
MVRVNHPPGGKMKLNDEAEPDSRTVRVLKPPGGGSSIVFDEDENMKPIKSKPQPQQQQPQPKEEAPQAEIVEKQAPPPPQEASDAKPETNGMNSHDSVKEDAAASRDSFPSPAPATNGQHSPAPNGSPAVNGSSAVNGSVSSGSTSSMSPFPGGTPKHLNTQTRIFGEDQHNVPTPRRRLRDHERSNIFADEGATNGTHRPDSSSSSTSSSCPSSGTPEARTPEQAPQPQPPQQQQQQQHRQRVPPGGFSTRLW